VAGVTGRLGEAMTAAFREGEERKSKRKAASVLEREAAQRAMLAIRGEQARLKAEMYERRERR
jgi:hypothetical protein